MTREEHLAWTKERALEYVAAGDLQNAVASMASDLVKHEAWRDSLAMSLLILDAVLFAIPDGASAVRRWIEGFN